MKATSSTSGADCGAKNLDSAFGTCIADKNGTILDFNDAFLTVLELPIGDLRGSDIAALLSSRTCFTQQKGEVFERLLSGRHWAGRCSITGSQGDRFSVHVTVNGTLGTDGKIDKFFLVVSRDAGLLPSEPDLDGELDAARRTLAIAEFDLDGRLVDANANYLGIYGFELSEVKGQHHSIFMFPEEADAERYHHLWTNLTDGQEFSSQMRRRRKDGQEIWLQASYCPVVDLSGRPSRIIKFATDITPQKLLDADREGQIEAIRKSLAVAEFSIDGILLDANDKFLHALGYRLSEVKGAHHSMFMPLDARNTAEYRYFWKRLRRGYFQSSQFERRAKNGSDVWFEATYNPVLTPSGKPYKIVKLARDITLEHRESIRMQAQNAHAAAHDTLTGLLNRTGLYRAVADRAAGRHRSASVMLIDLDGFKAANDRYGHAVGDELLRAVAIRLETVAKGHGLVARLGGDEFAIFSSRSDSTEEILKQIAADVVSQLGAPFRIGPRDISIGASVGIATSRGRSIELEQMLHDADIALYYVKENGKRAYRLFDDALLAEVLSARQLENDLETAIKDGSLTIEYQPTVRCRDREIVGVEALMRWHHPTRGWIVPTEFIQQAELSGLIDALGSYLIDKVVEDIPSLPKGYMLSLNVSPKQLKSGNFVHHLIEKVKTLGIEPTRLEVEITESAILKRDQHVLADLHALKSYGITVSLDDFGAGYASLSSLRLFPFDRLKIDRSLIAEILTDDQNAAIVASVIQLAHALNIEVIAEGVETQAQLEIVRAAGCDSAQGFLFEREASSEHLYRRFSHAS
ncbi:PAS domain S-box-containing protein/diguanylate cyclase (GGDEF) domain-containing protein [Ensifer adhaerens]|nr:PAS domain S-box-containing protein/diguanylate cyclase (GGDEF) domain-containing protein [Ensifer adhaerens]